MNRIKRIEIYLQNKKEIDNSYHESKGDGCLNEIKNVNLFSLNKLISKNLEDFTAVQNEKLYILLNSFDSLETMTTLESIFKDSSRSMEIKK